MGQFMQSMLTVHILTASHRAWVSNYKKDQSYTLFNLLVHFWLVLVCTIAASKIKGTAREIYEDRRLGDTPTIP